MLQINVCVANACQLKGSSEVVKAFQELIKKNHLEDRVELTESYCQGHCRRGYLLR